MAKKKEKPKGPVNPEAPDDHMAAETEARNQAHAKKHAPKKKATKK